MTQAFPIVKCPDADRRSPILVSIPHFGTQSLPGMAPGDYCEPWFETFAYGFADTFVGDLYADLHQYGATVLATPLSRIFVDVNRRRDDFEMQGDAIRSHRGVVRTHTIRDTPIFAKPLTVARLEARLKAYYDPYYATVERLLAEIHDTYGYALLIDGHTGSPRRMKDYEIIIGTRRGSTCDPALVEPIAAAFAQEGFEVHHNISGYTGGNLVVTYGHPASRRQHAVQLEINASLLMATSRQEFIAQVSRGEIPSKDEATIARLRACVQKAIRALPNVLAVVD
jgi:N-formylglutamate deformylase